MSIVRLSAPLILFAVVITSSGARVVHAQEPPRWAVRAEVGRSWVHDDDEGSAIALRVAGRTGEHVRIEGGLFGGSGFGGFDAGIELDFFPRSRPTLFVGAGLGVLGEDGFSGGFARANGGVAVGFSSRYALRVSGQTAVHGGERGPNLATVAMEVRFGRRR